MNQIIARCLKIFTGLRHLELSVIQCDLLTCKNLFENIISLQFLENLSLDFKVKQEKA